MRVHGKPLFKSARLQLPPRVGRLQVRESRKHTLGRCTLSARLLSDVETQADDLLPELTDVHLLWVDGAEMRLAGIETIGGVEYAQTWDIKALPC